MVFVSPLYVAW